MNDILLTNSVAYNTAFTKALYPEFVGINCWELQYNL